MIPDRPKYLLYGVALSLLALLGALFLNAVFERTWQAIALIMLAMLVVILVQRMIVGGIPRDPVPDKNPDDGPARPDLWTETAHLPGVDRRYGWLALPPLVTAVGVVVSMVF